MKTKFNTNNLKLFFVLFTVIFIQMNITAAGNPRMVTGLKSVFVVTSLAPTMPKEADFNDMPLAINDLYNTLQPVTPKEASFEDSGMEAYKALSLIGSLKPKLPVEAGFEE